MKKENISIGVHCLAAITAGFLSRWLENSAAALAVAVLILLITGNMAEKITKGKKNLKWWFANGLLIYIFIWLITWIALYNL